MSPGGHSQSGAESLLTPNPVSFGLCHNGTFQGKEEIRTARKKEKVFKITVCKSTCRSSVNGKGGKNSSLGYFYFHDWF